MRNILYILFLFISICIYGQNDLANKPWEIGCDTIDESQLEMNVCSYESYIIADNILTDLHEELAQYFENDLAKEKAFIKSPKDSIQIEYVNQLQGQLTKFKKSINDFYDYRKSTTEVIRLQYYGGTMSSLAVNTYALRLTVNQISTLRIMIKEIKNHQQG